MIGAERVIAVIPARGGSKGIAHKNIAPLGGRPLIVWSIEIAFAVDFIDRVIVSTDDDAIGRVAREHGAEVFKRPAALAGDDALVIDALRDLARDLEGEGEDAGIMVLLEPTCPFRDPEDVRSCIRLVGQDHLDSVATFKEAELNPHRAWIIDEGRPSTFIPGVDPWLPRQRLPRAYQLNGAVYCFRKEGLASDGEGLLFGERGAVIMPAERSVDIDRPEDLERAERLLMMRGWDDKG